MARMSDSLISFRNVTIRKGAKKALDRVSLDIGVEEHVAILGPNGSGKSTLIQAIMRQCYPWLGEPDWSLRILGRERWDVFELRGVMGIITSDLAEACAGNYSAREIVLSGFFSSIGVWPFHEVTAEMERKAGEALELLEIGHLADRAVNEMSSGEARRVLIGRALVHDPRALLFDEPTNSLDLRARWELGQILRKLAAAGKSILLVTHHVEDLIPEIERVILMRNGRVFRDGAKETVLTEGNLRSLFGVDVEMARRDGRYHLW